MSNIRLFFSAALSTNMTDKLDKSQSHYLTKVMRVKKMKFFLYLIKMENGKQKFQKYQKVLLNLKLQNNLDKKKIPKNYGWHFLLSNQIIKIL